MFKNNCITPVLLKINIPNFVVWYSINNFNNFSLKRSRYRQFKTVIIAQLFSFTGTFKTIVILNNKIQCIFPVFFVSMLSIETLRNKPFTKKGKFRKDELELIESCSSSLVIIEILFRRPWFKIKESEISIFFSEL